jgi:uncharacterized membrane protein YidH (DUF202 family)
MGPVRPVRTLGKWLGGLILAGLIAQALSVVIQLTLRNAAIDFLNSGDTSRFDDKLVVYSLIGMIAAGVAIAQIVILIIWTYRMAKNGLALGRTPQSFSAGATIAINLLGGCTLGILPFFMWRELWMASDPETAPGDLTWKRRSVSALIPVHLALVLAGVVAGIAVSAVGGFTQIRVNSNRTDLAKNLHDKLPLLALSGILSVATSVVFLVIVRQLTERHATAIRES